MASVVIGRADQTLLVEYLLAGGGASGGGVIVGSTGRSGGGGAGELVRGTRPLVPGSYLVSPGAAGPAGNGIAGENTTFGAFGLARGGGGGGKPLASGKPGGSGGGGSGGDNGDDPSSGTTKGGASTASQGLGYPGGGGHYEPGGGYAGGGGGAGGPGIATNGGPGVFDDITGTPVEYCVGGRAGSGLTWNTPGSGGVGTNGGSDANGAAGVAGIAIARYRGAQVATGGTVTTVTVGGVQYTVHTFTSADTFIIP